MTAGYKNGTITQPVIMTFWLFFFWTPFLPFSPHFFLPFMTSEAVHSQVSLRGACVSSHSLLFAWLSPLSTQYNCAIIRTASNRKSGRVRVTCSEKNDANSAAKDSNKGRERERKAGKWGAEREGAEHRERWREAARKIVQDMKIL